MFKAPTIAFPGGSCCPAEPGTMPHPVGRTLSLAILACLLLCSPLHAAPDGSVTRLVFEPSPLEITGGNRQQQVLVTAIMADGRHQDVTHEATLAIQDPAIASATGSVIRGVADGSTKLKVSYAGRRLVVPLAVTRFREYPPLDFRIDVLPLFSKLGCNSGGCHGKSTGQNGFKLSLMGFEPPQDYVAIVNEARGRRLFPGDPDRSLLLRKPTGQVPHGGGRTHGTDRRAQPEPHRLQRGRLPRSLGPPRRLDVRVGQLSEFAPPK